MDPLSAMRLPTLPGVPQALPHLPEKMIPVVELEKMGNMVGTQTITPQSTGQFSNVLGQLIDGVSEKQHAASEAVNGLLSGQNVSLHQAVIAMEEASVSFQLMVEVRNKLLDSYQELMRMQI